MDRYVKEKCRLLKDNRQAVKKAAILDFSVNQWLSAILASSGGIRVSESSIKSMRQLIKDNVGITSRFRSVFSLPAASVLASSRNSSTILKKALGFEEALRNEGFKRSHYTVLPSLFVAAHNSGHSTPVLARRAKMFFDTMKENSKIRLTEKEYGLAILMAASDLNVEEACNDACRCYDFLSGRFKKKESVLALSYILSLINEHPELKCQKALDIYDYLQAAGLKYGIRQELPFLGIMVMYPDSAYNIALSIEEIVDYLKAEKAVGLLKLSKSQALILSGSLLIMSLSSRQREQNISLDTEMILAGKITLSTALGVSVLTLSNVAAASC